jgi:hypothetical protein
MASPPSSAKAREDSPFRLFQRGRNYSLPKSTCPNRSEWRVLPGKAPERLSPYYQLGCEFGSALILSWRNEGSEPVYVCGEHAKEFEYSGVRASASSSAAETRKANEKEISGEAEAVPATAAPVAAAPADEVPTAADQAPTDPAAAGQAAAAPTPTPAATSPTAPVLVPVAAVGQESPAALNSNPVNGAPEAPRSATRAARGPAEQHAAIDRLVSDLTAQLENIFSQSEATISVVNTIDAPLEQATLAVIGNEAMAETQKDAAVQALGALQVSLKQDAGQDVTPLQAHRIKEIVANRLSGDASVVEEAKPGYRAVHDSLESAIHATTPKAKHLEERLANLLKMKAELENSTRARELTSAVA